MSSLNSVIVKIFEPLAHAWPCARTDCWVSCVLAGHRSRRSRSLILCRSCRCGRCKHGLQLCRCRYPWCLCSRTTVRSCAAVLSRVRSRDRSRDRSSRRPLPELAVLPLHCCGRSRGRWPCLSPHRIAVTARTLARGETQNLSMRVFAHHCPSAFF